MDFNAQKISHIFVFILLLLSFLLIFVLPIVTFFILLESPSLIDKINISEAAAIQSQLIVITVFILVPVIWYMIINKLKLREICIRIKLIGQNIDKAFLWGVLGAIIIFGLISITSVALISLGHKPDDLSNIPDLQKLFSPITMFFLVGIQPIGEEIFFRGFLFEKIEGYAGGTISIIVTSFLFGIAHMSYGKIFPVVMPIFMGLILGYIVYKTKNLYSAIIAHVLFNLTSLALAYLGQELLKQTSLIL